MAGHGEATALLSRPGDVALVERGRPRWLVMRCPCGCGEVVSLNVDRSAGAAWRYYHAQGALTIYPSVWREGGCECHFTVWRDRIFWCGLGTERAETAVRERVFAALPAGDLLASEDLAEALGEIPWEVLCACRELVRAGAAVEGEGPAKGKFGRSPLIPSSVS